ncbi:MAG: DUF1573 domain-containing protein [Planctomycetaceae bacterium]
MLFARFRNRRWRIDIATLLVATLFIVSSMTSCQRSAVPVSSESAEKETSAGPQLHVRQTEHRAESSDGHVRHLFEINSVGSEPVILKDVVSSCGCTVARPSETKIDPGKSATIDVDLHVMPSRRESSVFVKSNDPKRPVIELKVVATDAPERLAQFVPAVTRITPLADSEIEINSLLKIEQWSNQQSSFDFKDLKFQFSEGISSVESGAFSETIKGPIVWDEFPVHRGEKEITVKLLDRSVTLIPVRIRFRPNPSGNIRRDYARLDLPSSGGATTAIATFEILGSPPAQ